ncbi:MAG TPA: TolC family protein [Chthoniobacteraceae bacterium]|nr:TolC family protein [Chthoniobacteraceae bacterium]
MTAPLTFRSLRPRSGSALAVLVAIAGAGWFSSHPAEARGVPKPEQAEALALEAIDEIRRLEPSLPRPDNVPVAVGTGPIHLAKAVEIAIANNPTMQTRREQVRTAAINYIATQRGYGPQWRATMTGQAREVGSRFNEERTAIQYFESQQLLGFTQKLPYGGSIALDLGGALTQVESRPGDYSPRVVLSLNQPLLRRAGFDLYREPLVEARLNLLDALRNYKLQREDFVISIVSDYVSIQNIEQKIAINKEQGAAHDQLIRRSEAFFELGLESEMEVLRATQEALLVRQQRIDLQDDLENRRELFAITLGLTPDAKLELVPFPLPATNRQFRVQFDPQETVADALLNRPDLHTAADAVEENRRRLKYAKRNLLPDLDLNLSANARHLGLREGDTAIREEYTAGITLSLPLERTRERVQLFGAWQTLKQSERLLHFARANLAAAVHRRITRMASIENALELQDLVVANARKGAKVAAFRFERGQASNRSLLEAKNTEARALLRNLDLQLSHYLNYLQIKRDIGQLQIDPVFQP